jgi:hypothetical protein
MKLSKVLRLAELLSRFVSKSITKQKHAAAIIKNGKICAARTNCAGFHAETQVMKKHTSQTKLLVIRYENGTFKNSKPCKHCIETLRKTNIKKVIYSTGDSNNPFVIEKIDFLENNWISLMRKNKKLYSCQK